MDTYLNIGSIENFREYYTTYAELAIGEYEHWEEAVSYTHLTLPTNSRV